MKIGKGWYFILFIIGFIMAMFTVAGESGIYIIIGCILILIAFIKGFDKEVHSSVERRGKTK